MLFLMRGWKTWWLCLTICCMHACMLLGIWMMKLLDMACHSSKIHGFKILMSVLIHFANVKWTQNDLLNSDGHDFSFFTLISFSRLVSLLGPALSLSTGHPLGTLVISYHIWLWCWILSTSSGWLESWPKSGICSHQVRLWILTRPVTRYQGNRPNLKESTVCRKEMQTKTYRR